MIFLLYLPISVLGWLLAYPLVPIAVALADTEGRLPWALRWLETHDAPGWSGPATEAATRRTGDLLGPKAGLIHYLWRNKAYRLRHWMRARVSQGDKMSTFGSKVPPRFGPSIWFGSVGGFWELQPRMSLGFTCLYLRIGWKMRPYFDGPWPPEMSAAGIYVGISIRSDDWDDFRV